jgi:hypothetical protein
VATASTSIAERRGSWAEEKGFLQDFGGVEGLGGGRRMSAREEDVCRMGGRWSRWSLLGRARCVGTRHCRYGCGNRFLGCGDQGLNGIFVSLVEPRGSIIR